MLGIVATGAIGRYTLAFVIYRKAFLALCVLAATACGDGSPAPEASDKPPNVIVVFVDDLGYGDLSSYGSLGAQTPNLDALAASGVRFTEGYVGNSVCTPSRAVLLTGRDGPRQVLEGTLGGVYFPMSEKGMSPDQVTMAEVLSGVGYRTALVGKWHLGQDPGYLPMDQGFDEFFGLPYSNDMDPLPLLEGETQIDTLETVDISTTRLGSDSKQATLTGQYTDRALRFIRASHDAEQPFFLYYANNFPHTPLAASPMFEGTSPSCADVGATRGCGLYGDVMAELDWSVGEIVDELADLGIDRETIVVFTSDNGAWLIRGEDGGSNGPLREGKSTTFEGGYRVPMIATWKGTYREGAVESSPVAMVDWMATFAAEAGATLPSDRVYDGMNLGPLLRGDGPRDPAGEPFRMVYFRNDNETPGAYREGKWKYKAPVELGESVYAIYEHGDLLFDLEADPGEQNDLSAENPELVERLRTAMLDATSELLASRTP